MRHVRWICTVTAGAPQMDASIRLLCSDLVDQDFMAPEMLDRSSWSKVSEASYAATACHAK